jgi:hypothetical protein
MSAAIAAADTNLDRTRLRVAMLNGWAKAGMAMARKLGSESGRGLVEASATFLRIAQAVRLAAILVLRLCDPTNPAYQPTPAKPRAPRAVEAEKRETEPPEKPERDGPGRGEREISDDAILRRPLKAIVKVICRNLGIVPDWSLWTDADETLQDEALQDEAPKPAKAAAPAKRPRSEPIPPPGRLQGTFLHRTLGRRLIWTSPAEPAPAPASLRTRLRSTASPLALDPIAPRRAVAPACPDVPGWVREPSGSPFPETKGA